MAKQSSKYIAQRNSELRQAFRRACECNLNLTTMELWHIAVATPCSRYWVELNQARKTISAIRRGLLLLSQLPPNKAAMYASIIARCHGDYSSDNLSQVIDSPAPSFFISAGSAVVALCKERSKLKQKKID